MRSRITTTIEENLLNRTKKFAKENIKGKDGVNAVIEKALELYFSSYEKSVWEKSLSSGWVKKLVIQGESVIYENIKCRKELHDFRQDDYSEEELLKRGWKKV